MGGLSTLLEGNRALFTLSAGGGRELRVVRFTASEGLSGLFEVNVELAGPEMDVNDIIDTPMTLEIASIDTHRFFSGVCASFEYVGSTRELQLYEAQIVPWMWRLQFRQSSRIFQDMSTPDIIKKVLADAGMAGSGYRLDLAEAYKPRNYCVQYQESDLAFISRLLEEDGIFYFFEHTADDHVLVFADHSGAHKPIPGDPQLWFMQAGGDVSDREDVQSFRFGERVRPGTVTMRDFNLHKPSERMEADKAAKKNVELEIYTYPGGFQDPGRGGSHQGKTLAQLRLEAHQAIRRVGSGTSDSPRLTAGHTFTMTGHPRESLDIEYRILQVHHIGKQSMVLDHDGVGGEFGYENSFTVNELSVPFRTPQLTPRPAMRGLQTATVVGPASEEVYVDEHGRVKVQFHWDRDEPYNETSSCWVRVSQVWAGQGWGTMFIPRIGHEVLVDFIEGDPDRPVITGRVYTGENQPPYPLPAEKTKSTIKSESSIGGGGFNELRFEDSKGSEQIYIHAQKDMDEDILNNHTEDVGVDETITVGSNQSIDVGANRTIHVGGNMDEKIDGTETRKVTGAVDETFSATETRNISADQTETIGGSVTRTVSGSVTETVSGSVTATVSGSVTETVSGSVSQTVTGGITVTTPAAIDITAVGGLTVTAAGGVKFIAPAGFTVIAPGGTRTIDYEFVKFGGGQADLFTWQIGISALKFDGVGVATAAIGVKCEYVALEIKTEGFTFDEKVLDLHMVASKIMTAAIWLNTSGITSIL